MKKPHLRDIKYIRELKRNFIEKKRREEKRRQRCVLEDIF
jgi:hypothetical protein